MGDQFAFGAKRWLTVKALALLVVTDMALAILGFPRLYRLLVKTARRQPAREADPELERRTVAEICAAVDGATRLYYRLRKDCLQRSLLAFYMLRRNGILAELCIGAKKFPFAAHSWVEYHGAVVNDSARKVRGYKVITRV